MGERATRPIYVSTAALGTTRDLWETLATYRRAGLTHVELGACGPLDIQGEALAARLEAQGLSMVLHSYFPPATDPFVLNLASPDAGIRDRSAEHALEALELSARLGAPFYSVHAGFVTDPTGFGTGSFVLPHADTPQAEEDALELFVAALSLLLDHARRLGVTLLVENNVCTPDLRGLVLVADTDGAVAVLDALRPSDLGLLIDFGHLNVSATTLGFDRDAFLAAVAPRIGSFHLHDNDGDADSHRPPSRDSWTLRELRRPEFERTPVTLEARFDDMHDLMEHMGFLRAELEREDAQA